jgi:hypothetical protein
MHTNQTIEALMCQARAWGTLRAHRHENASEAERRLREMLKHALAAATAAQPKLPEAKHFYYSPDDHRPVRKPLPLYTKEQVLEMLAAATAAQPSIPEGWKLVPIEPTQAMIDAMPPVEEVGYWAMYEAAIAAAPATGTTGG